MKILALCTSPYQLLIINRIVEENYKQAHVCIAIADTIADCDSLIIRLRKEDAFDRILKWKIKTLYTNNRINQIRRALIPYRHAKTYTCMLDGCDDVYDTFLFANCSPVTSLIITTLKHNNSAISLEMYEDGFSTYSNYTGKYLNERSIKALLLRRVFRDINNLYIFNPQIMEWTPKFKTTIISPTFKGDCLNRINRIFGYDCLSDDYSKKIIFFEESYAADGKQVDDIELVNAFAEIFGKENIFVKIHPRNPTNRFHELGYTTNSNTVIPWEVIVINSDFSKSIFVSLASNAAMNPFFLFGVRTPVFLLFKCSKTPDAMYRNIIDYDYALCSRYPDIFNIPLNYNELIESLKRIARG